MRDPARIPVVLEILGVVWEAVPDLRFGQLINLIGVRSGDEEDHFISAARDFARATLKNQHCQAVLLKIDGILAAEGEGPIGFDSLDALLADLDVDSLTTSPAETLCQMRAEEQY